MSVSRTGSRILQQHLFSLLQPTITPKQTSQIHTQIITNGFTQKQFILVRLLSLYVTFKNLSIATKIFHLVENPSTTLWNQLIRGHGRNSENLEKCVEIFGNMERAMAKPDEYTYMYLISGCSKGGLVKEGEEIHGKVIKNGFDWNVFVNTSLVHFYCVLGGESGVLSAWKVFGEMNVRNVVTWNSLLSGYFSCGGGDGDVDVDGARRVFKAMPERNVVSWTTMIAGLARNGMSKEAVSLFYEMWGEGVQFDQVILVAVLSACSELCDLRLGKWIHLYVITILVARDFSIMISLNNALIHMYASCGVIREAYKIFKRMPQRTTVSWTSIITGFARQGYAEDSLNLYREMESLGGNDNRPDEITFLGVLSACSRGGYVDEGRRCFKLMSERWGIEPKIEHYGCMVDILSRAGLLDQAERVIESMPMKPNEVIWGTLLGGCRIHRNVELATHVAEKLEGELNPERVGGYFLLLFDVYSSAKKFNEVVSLRRKMIEMGVKKPPGQSWIQFMKRF